MVRSRCILILSLAAFLAILFPILAWCGPPVAPSERGAPERGEQPSQMPPGPAPSAPVASNFNAAGSVGNTGATGSLGISPSIDMRDLGLTNDWGISGRAKYVILEESVVPATFIYDYSVAWLSGNTTYSGSVNSTTFPALAGRVPDLGVPIESELSLSLMSFHLDLDATRMLDSYSVLQGGLRVSYVIYNYGLHWAQSSTNREHTGTKNYGIPGLGLWANLDLSGLTGYGGFDTSEGSVRPVLHFAAGFGQSAMMRYNMWEATLEVFSSRERYVTDYATLPPVMFEIGYARYDVTETVDEADDWAGLATHADHTMDVMILRATLDLPSLNF